MESVEGYPHWKKQGNMIFNVDQDGLASYKKHKQALQAQRSQVVALSQQVQRLEKENVEINTKLDQILFLLQGKQ